MADAFEDALNVARREAARVDLPAEDPYLELMATHVEMGELLTAGVSDVWAAEDFTGLANQLVASARDQTEYDGQRFAVWLSRITSGGAE